MPEEHPRVELDPPEEQPDPKPSQPGAPAKPIDDDLKHGIDALVRRVGADPESFDGSLVRDLVLAGLKLIPDGRDTGQIKLITAAIKELRYAYRVFGRYPDPHKVTIFGSARTPEDDPDFGMCVEFSKLMADSGWMVITGAGDGIMKAGHVGPGRTASFGVAIRLPFETTANDVIMGDEKLIHFRYFFTRKLMFLSQAEAVALFPGGFGTLDEAYEALTLIQTGKASMIPVVLAAAEGNDYWERWEEFTRKTLLARKYISEEDLNLFYKAHSAADAAEHIRRFYRVYHSARYVRDDLVIRLKHPISQTDVERLGDEFKVLIRQGPMRLQAALGEEDDHLDLPRLVFTHTRYKYGLVRSLIDRINECQPTDGSHA